MPRVPSGWERAVGVGRGVGRSGRGPSCEDWGRAEERPLGQIPTPKGGFSSRGDCLLWLVKREREEL